MEQLGLLLLAPELTRELARESGYKPASSARSLRRGPRRLRGLFTRAAGGRGVTARPDLAAA